MTSKVQGVGNKTELREKQAIEWHNLVQHGEPSQDELVAYIDWVRGSAENERALSEVENIRGLLTLLESDKQISKLVDQRAADCRNLRKPVPEKRQRRDWQSGFAGLAAGIAVMVGVVFYLKTSEPEVVPLRYVTAVGQQKIYRLEDDTQVNLNTDTAIVVHYSAAKRVIELERGEVLFDVAQDPDRPFIVDTDFGMTRALGTLFNVRVHRDRVAVSLLEGMVEVTAAGEEHESRKLAPGQQISSQSDGALSAVQAVNEQDVLLWTKRLFNFQDATLEQAVAEINRYSAIKLVIADASIKDVKINLRIGVDKVDSFLSVCEELFGIKTERKVGKVILSRASDS